MSLGYVDTHAHILPGVDDGCRSYEESISIGRVAYSAGISHMTATPHLWDERTFLSAKEMDVKVAELNRVFSEEGIGITVWPGAEVYITDDVPRMIRQRVVPVRMAGQSDCVLIEFPFGEVPRISESVLSEIVAGGVTPLLAHMERNAAVQRDTALCRRFVDMGCLIQIDAASLTGDLGAGSKIAAEELLRQDIVFAMASDVHYLDARIKSFSHSIERATALVGREQALRIVRDNPSQLLPANSAGTTAVNL